MTYVPKSMYFHVTPGCESRPPNVGEKFVGAFVKSSEP